MDGASRVGLVVLAVGLLLCCSSLRAVARPHDWGEVVRRLSPFAPQPRPTTPTHELDALTQAFVSVPFLFLWERSLRSSVCSYIY
jgi:hypothetical protein